MLRKLLGARIFGAAGDPVDTTFGILERDVLDVLWTRGDLAVRDVQSQLARPIAYTTVMTTLDRLYKKGVLDRRRVGRAFRYSAALTREQLRASIAGSVLAGLLRSRDAASAPILSNLIDSVAGEAHGEELLQRLEELVRDKRRQLSRKS